MLSSVQCILNIENEHVRYDGRPVGEHVAAPAAEDERQAYAHYLPSLCAIVDHYLRGLSEALVDVDVVKNVGGANFANCLHAELNEMKAE